MKVIKTIEEMSQFNRRNTTATIGFVPTMGFLHEGHLSLAREAKNKNDVLVMSIFVNPLQFGPNEDFKRYPRNEERDVRLAEKVGVDVLFMPSLEEMYPVKSIIQMEMIGRVDVLCGASRPGHFDGVITVLTKFFHIVKPTNVYFGLKDAQQIAVVDALITDLNFPITLIGLPTKREVDGLAMSSRNVYLSNSERKEATVLYKSLQKAKSLIEKGIVEKKLIIDEIRQMINDNTSGKIDYVSIFSYPNLEEVQQIDEQVIIAVAVYFKQARLIDNIIISNNGNQMEIFTRGEA